MGYGWPCFVHKVSTRTIPLNHPPLADLVLRSQIGQTDTMPNNTCVPAVVLPLCAPAFARLASPTLRVGGRVLNTHVHSTPSDTCVAPVAFPHVVTVHHKVTFILCRPNVHHQSIRRPLPPQSIHKVMINNPLVLLWACRWAVVLHTKGVCNGACDVSPSSHKGGWVTCQGRTIDPSPP